MPDRQSTNTGGPPTRHRARDVFSGSVPYPASRRPARPGPVGGGSQTSEAHGMVMFCAAASCGTGWYCRCPAWRHTQPVQELSAWRRSNRGIHGNHMRRHLRGVRLALDASRRRGFAFTCCTAIVVAPGITSPSRSGHTSTAPSYALAYSHIARCATAKAEPRTGLAGGDISQSLCRVSVLDVGVCRRTVAGSTRFIPGQGDRDRRARCAR